MLYLLLGFDGFFPLAEAFSILVVPRTGGLLMSGFEFPRSNHPLLFSSMPIPPLTLNHTSL
ncbi:hypothetical protein JCM19046_761 [Bacillus sp. JCM 19046]|nr:hypothetical protein JCM19046_761 [Bacillus sp. JCM 19046]